MDTPDQVLQDWRPMIVELQVLQDCRSLILALDDKPVILARNDPRYSMLDYLPHDAITSIAAARPVGTYCAVMLPERSGARVWAQLGSAPGGIYNHAPLNPGSDEWLERDYLYVPYSDGTSPGIGAPFSTRLAAAVEQALAAIAPQWAYATMSPWRRLLQAAGRPRRWTSATGTV